MTELKTINDVVNASSADLVAWYNAHSGKPAITKFSDRKTAEKRVASMIMEGSAKPAHKEEKPAPVPAQKEEKPKKPAKEEKPAPQRDYAPDMDTREKMSAAQRESWKEDEVRAARCERSAVNVDGVDYRSVGQAFEELGLPAGKMVAFRMKLKEAGKLKEFDHKWEIIPLNY